MYSYSVTVFATVPEAEGFYSNIFSRSYLDIDDLLVSLSEQISNCDSVYSLYIYFDNNFIHYCEDSTRVYCCVDDYMKIQVAKFKTDVHDLLKNIRLYSNL